MTSSPRHFWAKGDSLSRSLRTLLPFPACVSQKCAQQKLHLIDTASIEMSSRRR
ncbi:hypothetical protein NC652_031689 [Populus alba x Populus x berolinensis]|nr:hypothetical protein NC652_031689 [Populus alba x Populus x berolinensis]